MRALVPALAGSVALHAAVFAALPRAGPEAKPVARLPATVDVEIGMVGPAAAEARSAVVRSEPVKRRRRIRAATATATATPTATATATSTPTSNATAIAIATATPHPGSPAGGGGAATPTSDPDLDLTAFFTRLQRAAQRCSGPRQGEGRVRFCVGADGAPTEVSLVQTTGNFALDDAALHCVIPGAAPFPHTDRCLVVPLAFH